MVEMRTAVRALLLASTCMAALVACGADEAEPGAGSSGLAASSSGDGGSSSGDAAVTSSGAPADAGGGPTGRDVPIGMGGPTASSSGTPDAAVGLQCVVDPPPPLAAPTACKLGRTTVDPLGQLQTGVYTLTGYWSCAGFTAVTGHASIYVENDMVGMRYVRLESGGDAGAGPADPIEGTWRLIALGAGVMTRQEVCGQQANDEPEDATFNYQNGILRIALPDHDERWVFGGEQ